MVMMVLDEMTREEAKAIAPAAIALLPTGATEQHGPHLPTGTDTLAVGHIARGAAMAAGVSVVVTPTLSFGSSAHHIPFGGTMSVSTETYYRLVRDLCESLLKGGFQRIFILNGHGGNNELVQLVVRDLAQEYRADFAAASYWVAAREALLGVTADVPGRVPGDAGAFESSLVMALQPHLVKEPRPHRDEPVPEGVTVFYPPVRIERHDSWQAIDGYSDSPDRATAELGRNYLETVIGAIAAALAEFHRATGGET